MIILKLVQLLIDYADKNNIILELNEKGQFGYYPLLWYLELNEKIQFGYYPLLWYLELNEKIQFGYYPLLW